MNKNNKIPSFEIDISQIKIAGSEKDVSHTIEELLALNKMIPKRWDEPAEGLTEAQLEDSDKSENTGWRGEVEKITEGQFGDRKEPEYQILEVEAETKPSSDGGHREEAWDLDKVETKGHKNVPPIWIEVYNKEDERKDNGELNKTLGE